jgi:hypothetical protein
MIAATLALALAAQLTPAPPVRFRLSASAVRDAFDRLTDELMSDPDVSYHPPGPRRYSSARCVMTAEPDVAECRFRVTVSNGKSFKVRNRFTRLGADSWIAHLEL